MYLLVYLFCLFSLESQFYEDRDFVSFTAVSQVPINNSSWHLKPDKEIGEYKSLPRNFCNLKQKKGSSHQSERNRWAFTEPQTCPEHPEIPGGSLSMQQRVKEFSEHLSP